MYNYRSDITVSHVTFSGNVAASGGGIFNTGFSASTLTNITFTSNAAIGKYVFPDREGGGYGGGIYNSTGGNFTLVNATFSGNRAEAGGGGIYNLAAQPNLINTTFTGNVATGYEREIFDIVVMVEGLGGGMMNIENSTPAISNGVFAGNRARYGGGIYNFGSAPTLTNATLSGNRANVGGGMRNVENSTPLIQNTIIWANSAWETVPNLYNEESVPTIRYSIVQDGLAGSTDGGNNLFVDPHFVRGLTCGNNDCSDYGDLHLLPTSIALDAGDNAADVDGAGEGSATIAFIGVDRDSNPRVIASLRQPATVDLGAYERVNVAAANAGGPYLGNEGSPIALDGSASHDDGGITTYAWDCTADGTADTSSDSPTGSSCTYPDDGDFTLHLTTTDNLGITGTATTTVVIANIAPVLTSPSSQAATAGSATPFNLGDFTDPGAEGAWPVTVNWGDNTSDSQFNATSAGALSPLHTYASAGTYDVVVTVSDGEAQDDGSFQVVVDAPPPGAPVMSAAADQSATAGEVVNFALGSFTDDEDTGPWQVTIDWGDNSPATSFAATAAGTLPDQSHTYNAAGTYNVVVTVHDGESESSAAFTVSVSPGSSEAGGVTGVIFTDTNNNGVQDTDEPGIPGVQVTLTDEAAAASVTLERMTVTDDNGHYRFDNVPAGEYELVIEPPPGYTIVGPTQQSVSVESGGSTTTVPGITAQPEGEKLYLPAARR
jgi:hypothetical protein